MLWSVLTHLAGFVVDLVVVARHVEQAKDLAIALLRHRLRQKWRDMDAARRFFQQALAIAGEVPARVTTAGHPAYPRAIRETLGPAVAHRASRYNNNRVEQDHRGVQHRYYPMRGCGSFASAARFCTGFEEQRQYFRTQARSGEPVSLAERRRRFQDRWAAAMAGMAA